MIPQTISNTFIDELNAALGRSRAPSEFELQRWRRSAQALLKKSAEDAADGYQLLGMLAVFSGDLEAIRQNFATALRLQPGNATLLSNRAIAYANALSSELAMAQIDTGEIDTHAGNIIRVIAGSGRLLLADELLKKAGDDVMNDGCTRTNLDAPLLHQLAAQLAKAPNGEAVLSRWINRVESMLRERLAGTAYVVTQEYGWHTDCGGWIHYRTPLSVEDSVELNFAIADVLAADADAELSALPAIMVLPHADQAH